jgi:hypothetical protein
MVWVTFIYGNNQSFCSDLPSFDVIGSPVLNRTIDTAYIIGGNGTFYAISIKDGSTSWDIPDTYDPSLLSNYGSLLLYNEIIYGPFGSHCDLKDYHGGIYMISIKSRSVIKNFLPDYLSVGGGVWGLGGLTLHLTQDSQLLLY